MTAAAAAWQGVCDQEAEIRSGVRTRQCDVGCGHENYQEDSSPPQSVSFEEGTLISQEEVEAHGAAWCHTWAEMASADCNLGLSC